MSHFTVLVIGQDPEKQLAPFHEFECTGLDDQYVIDVDETAEALKEYNSSTSSMVKVPAGVVVPPGTLDLTHHPVHGALVSRYASCFQVPNPEFDAEAHFLDRKPQTIFALPEGYEEIEVPTPEVDGFEAFILDWYGRKSVPYGEQPDLSETHKYGYVLLDEAGRVVKVVRRTNPNKKWDWYVLGGRWAGFFRMKPRVRGVQGRPGLMTASPGADSADSAFKKDIDFDRMRRLAEMKAAGTFDTIRKIIEPHLPVIAWEALREKYLGENPELPGGIAAAREAYAAQPAVQALKASENHCWEDAEDYAGDRDTFIRHQGIRACMTFAVLKDGQWYQRGEMGWWACVSDDKGDAWIEEFAKLMDSLPDDTLLSVYDCHI